MTGSGDITPTKICHATPAKMRAMLVIGFPIVGVGYAITIMLTRGYQLTDYPLLIAQGQLGWFSQAFGWVSGTAWILLFWPPAWSALQEKCLIGEDDDAFWLAAGRARLSKQDVDTVELVRGLVMKRIKLRMKDGRVFEQPVALAKERDSEIAEKMAKNLESTGSYGDVRTGRDSHQ